MSKIIKGVLLDYGGTIDSNGVHWGEVLWQAYVRHEIPVSKEVFRQAFAFGEKTLAVKPLIDAQHNFLDVLTIKLTQQFSYLHDNGFFNDGDKYDRLIPLIASECNNFAAGCIAGAAPVLQGLAGRYPVVLVSNFYGNIEAVLETFGIRRYFTHIIESAVVGVRKPDPQIFSLGVEALGLAAEECVVVGDSYTKDIQPGKGAGCQTVWLKGDGWEPDPENPFYADRIIKSFNELPTLL